MHSPTTQAPSRVTLKLARLGLVFGVVLVASLIGIASRPAGLLATIWPANAILLGLFVRNRNLAAPAGWAAAFAGFCAADLLTGAAPAKTVLLTAANLAGVAAGFALFLRLDKQDRRLRRPLAVLCLGLITAASAAVSAVGGAIANPVLFGGTALHGFILWFITEFVNYIAFLPVALTIPPPSRHVLQNLRDNLSIRTIAPLAALVLSCIASIWIGGPGSVAFPVPALLWCALVYNLTGTAIVTLLFSTWTLLAIASGAIQIGDSFDSIASIQSIRIGVALMALAPITVASVMVARDEFQLLLQKMVTNDPLTAALNRRTFTVRCRNLLAPLASTRSPVSVLLFDVADFKTINARYGYAAGDEVLKVFSRIARRHLPHPEDLGRMSADEFAVLLPGYAGKEAEALADRISMAFANSRIELAPGHAISAAVNIGIALSSRPPASVEPLLTQAQTALDRAKTLGGSRSAFADEWITTGARKWSAQGAVGPEDMF